MYLKRKTVRGYQYWQLVEAYRDEGGLKKDRVLLHLGPHLESSNTLVKWWSFLGRPPIPLREGRIPGQPSAVANDLAQFLALNRSDHAVQGVIRILKQLSLSEPGLIKPVYDKALSIDMAQPGPEVVIAAQDVFLFDGETGQILDTEGLKAKTARGIQGGG